MSAPKGPASISMLLLPSPSVVVGDVMRDSNGVPAPLDRRVRCATAQRSTDVDAAVLHHRLAAVAHLDANRIARGDKLGIGASGRAGRVAADAGGERAGHDGAGAVSQRLVPGHH